ncbi:hypothetical protein [Halalkalibacterium halodurans]|uniref:hypothetical protein n=1 Tax=Halalkalibacterium halodurans TaxID=86665 RepID=UPI002AA9830F|nr:hypothetical protein [Halalkalibacterium halodurans]MDY7224556.1 hypothetical protein [Halalkalibacterium halodurans]MDY7243841.1 hypothetical protein [Halalkalibacterium halodurans]
MKVKWIFYAVPIFIGAILLFYLTHHTDLSTENINNLTLDVLYFPVDNLNHSVDPYSDGSVNYTYEDGLQVRVNQGNEVIRIWVQSPGENYKTEKNIIIGDRVSKIMEQYGDHDYLRSEQGSTIYGYIDRKLNYRLEFWTNDDIIYTIRFDQKRLD